MWHKWERAYRVLVRRPDGNRQLGRYSRRWDDNKMDLQELGWGFGLDYSSSGLEQVVGFYERGNELSGPIKYGEYLD